MEPVIFAVETGIQKLKCINKNSFLLTSHTYNSRNLPLHPPTSHHIRFTSTKNKNFVFVVVGAARATYSEKKFHFLYM